MKTINPKPEGGLRMEKKIAPSVEKAQALRALLQGQHDAQGGEELLST